MKARITLAAVLAVLVTAGAATASTGIPLAAEWTFDADQGTTVVDASGNNDNGVLSGPVSRVAGFSGTALSFNGASGMVQVPDAAPLQPTRTVTVAAWVQGNGSPGRFRYIAAKGWSGCTTSSYALYTGPSGGLQFYVGIRQRRAYTRSPDVGASIWNGAWHLVVGTYDGSTVRLYVDGIAVGSGTAVAGNLSYSLPGSNDFFIGNYPGCADRTFKGTIDDVRVWDSTLSPAQITALMPQPAGNPGSGSGTPSGSTAPGTTTTGNPSPGSGTPSGSMAPGTTTTGNGSPAQFTAADGQPVGDPRTDVPLLRPRISGLRVALASRVSLQTERRARTKVSRSVRSTITYRDTQPARSTLTVQRALAGIRVQGRCVGASSRSLHRQAPSCTRWLKVESFSHADAIGLNTIKRILVPSHAPVGRYRLQVAPVLGQVHGTCVAVGFRL